MKIIKITSLGCPSCIIMNKVFNEIKKEYSFELEEYDFDFDSEKIQIYNVGKILPVYIFYINDEEKHRICGEHNLEEVKKVIKDIEV